MNSVQRIGVFGGTFDPVHNAHIEIARAALAHAQLDMVLFVVSARPPHKTFGPFASADERYALVEAALSDCPAMIASRIEIERPGLSYTVDTLRLLTKVYPGAELFLLIGYDSLIDLPNWREPDEIASLARFLVAPRPGECQSLPERFSSRCELLPFHETDLSSTEVRSCITEGRPIDDLVPPDVARLIAQWGLYRD